jgi:adenosine/AMP kinase
VPSIKFGLAFCEASGKCLVRCSGTELALTELARKNAAPPRTKKRKERT